MNKYKITSKTKTNSSGITLYQIEALRTFTTADGTTINKGDLGGWIEKEDNLSQDDKAWIYNNAEVYGKAKVYDNAEVWGSAKVYSNAKVYGEAKVCGNAKVYGEAKVFGDATVHYNAELYGDAAVYGSAELYGDAAVYGSAELYGNAAVYGNAQVYGKAQVYGNAEVCGEARVYGNAIVCDNTETKEQIKMKHNTTENIHLLGNASFERVQGIETIIEVVKQYENDFPIDGYIEALEFYQNALDKIVSRIFNNLKYIDRQT